MNIICYHESLDLMHKADEIDMGWRKSDHKFIMQGINGSGWQTLARGHVGFCISMNEVLSAPCPQVVVCVVNTHMRQVSLGTKAGCVY